MSFTNNPLEANSPNYISCYFTLKPRSLRRNNNIILGNISGPFSISEINAIDPNFTQPNNTIIRNIPNQPTHFIVGIPRFNGNNVPRKKIYSAMTLYDTSFLRDIVPYRKLAGNDTTIPENLADCSGVQFLTNGNVIRTHRVSTRSIIDRLGINNRICIRNTRYF